MSETDNNNGESRPTAAEYVLGVLDAAERRALERRLPNDRALAREVEFWEARLGPLADGIAPISPPATTWWRIEGALGPAEPAPAPRTAKAAGMWQSIAFWRAFAIGSSGFAAACLGALFYIALVPDARLPLIATINSSSGQPNFVATVTGGNSLTVVPAALLTNDPRAMELWLIVPGDQPRSLGLIEAGREVRINLPRDLAARVASDVTLAVSLEPPGGSPTGQPTGPVIATGKLTNL
jgi:anti-sigma-K factor RskA